MQRVSAMNDQRSARRRSIAVYCGSSPGADPSFAGAARDLGRAIAQRDYRLVYGGGHVGLMGQVADAALESGGEVLGVITRALADKEVAHAGLTTLHVVTTMHERKALMADESDAFVMMPGGFGTLDEFFEVLTWTQLGIHDKPCAVLNVEGYFDSLLAFVDGAVDQRFVVRDFREAILVDDDPSTLLDRIEVWEGTSPEKWLDRYER